MDFASFANEVGTGKPITVELAGTDGDEPVVLSLRHPTGKEKLELHAEVSELLSKIQEADGKADPYVAGKVADTTVRWTARLSDPPMGEDVAGTGLFKANATHKVFVRLVALVLPDVEDKGAEGVDDADRFPNDAGP